MQQRRGAIAALGIAIALLAGVFVVATTAHAAGSEDGGRRRGLRRFGQPDRRPRLRDPDADGRTVEFRIGQLENGAQFPPGHLGVHQADAVPVRVTYRDENGEHVAIRLEDAPAAVA